MLGSPGKLPVEKAALTISLPQPDEFVMAKPREGRFSAPEEYIRFLKLDERPINPADLTPACEEPKQLPERPRHTRCFKVERKG
ncbi:MAG TPA: hypothetical protein VKU01_12890 [Bryobacteraceae bacterium]|nr:hypothetical protein [Bryobacteraceae bacterium]